MATARILHFPAGLGGRFFVEDERGVRFADLNKESQSSFDAGPTATIDDGKDVLFGDAGNDWLVGGTNQDVLFGGAGNDLMNGDDNLDSTRVDGSVTYASLCSLSGQYASDPKETAQLCNQLAQIQAGIPHWTTSQLDDQIDQWGETVTRQIGNTLSADQSATLLRLAQALKPDYSPLANNTTDAVGGSAGDLTEADILFGGTGRDIMVVNTASDRAVDWNNPSDTVYFPWEGGAGAAVVNGPHDDLAQALLALGLALGADPTRPEVPLPFAPAPALVFSNGEPFGELGLVNPPRDFFPEDTGPYWLTWGPSAGMNPGLHLEGAADNGSIGTLPAVGPTADLEQIEKLKGLDAYAEALLARIVVRGQLTPAEQAALSPLNTAELALLVAGGWVASTGGVVAPTSALWLALGLADAPTLAYAGPVAPNSGSWLTFTGTGDAGDTITLYDGTVLVGTAIVALDGTWSLVVKLTAGIHTLAATETVNATPEAGLTSVRSKAITVAVAPAAPSIGTVTKAATSVTVSGTGVAGDTITLYDGGKAIGTVVVASNGTWSLTVKLALGTHTLTATQTLAPGLVSPASASATVSV